MSDEFSRKCLTIFCARRIGSVQVIEQMANAMIVDGIPEYIRSDNGPKFIAKELRSWLSGIGVKLLTLNQAALGRIIFAKALTASL